MALISYINKVALNENPEIADINKVTDDDLNEIKSVVNENFTNEITISDTEPTSESCKLWIDTGEVQNLGSEVHIGDTINSKIGLNILMGKNLFNKNSAITNYRLASDGTLYADNGYFTSEYIEVKSNTNYIVNITPANTKRICFYDNTYTFLGYVDSTQAFTTTGSTKYVRFAGLTSEIDTIQLEQGSTATTYQPYITPAINVYGEDIYVKGQNEVYSTQEQRIGTWIDGKPLYRRVLESNYITTGEYTMLDNSYSLNVVMIYGWILKPSTGYILPYGTFMNTASSYTCRVFFDGTNVKVQQGTNYQDGTFKARVVIEYTKKTD